MICYHQSTDEHKSHIIHYKLPLHTQFGGTLRLPKMFLSVYTMFTIFNAISCLSSYETD